jgi:hypothetical protein
MEAIHQDFETNLYQDDYLGNAIGAAAAYLQVMGELPFDPEMMRVRNFYTPKKLTEKQDAGGKRYAPTVEANFEPELIEYCDALVDQIKDIMEEEGLSDEARAEKITAVYQEGKSMKNMNDIFKWRDLKEAERLWREGPNQERKAA